MTAEAEYAVAVRITGHVQGVSFRWACQREAERLGVAGWVSNEADESVAGHFEGTRDAVEALVAWCRSGPRGAQVERVDVQDADAAGASGFDIR